MVIWYKWWCLMLMSLQHLGHCIHSIFWRTSLDESWVTFILMYFIFFYIYIYIYLVNKEYIVTQESSKDILCSKYTSRAGSQWIQSLSQQHWLQGKRIAGIKQILIVPSKPEFCKMPCLKIFCVWRILCLNIIPKYLSLKYVFFCLYINFCTFSSRVSIFPCSILNRINL